MKAGTKSKRLPQLPPAAEWDFRCVLNDEIDAAVEYEYYREDPELRSHVEVWLSSPFPKWEPLKISHEERETRLLAHFARVDRGLAKLDEHRIWPPVEVTWRTNSFTTVKEAYFSVRHFGDLPFDVQVAMMDRFPFTQTALIEWVANFPTPWLKIPKERRFTAKRPSTLVPLSDPPYEDLRISRAQEKQRTARYHSIRIDWDAQPKQIIASFKKWLKTAKPKDVNPTQTRGRSNRKGLLKCLSAFRLHKVVGYEAAQSALENALEDDDSNKGLIPIYQDRKHWDRARKGAKDFLAERKCLYTLKPPQELEIDLSVFLDS